MILSIPALLFYCYLKSCGSYSKSMVIMKMILKMIIEVPLCGFVYRFIEESLSFAADEGDANFATFNQLKTAFQRLDSDISSETAPVAGVYDEDFLEVCVIIHVI